MKIMPIIQTGTVKKYEVCGEICAHEPNAKRTMTTGQHSNASRISRRGLANHLNREDKTSCIHDTCALTTAWPSRAGCLR
jgi:hypothetical protein